MKTLLYNAVNLLALFLAVSSFPSGLKTDPLEAFHQCKPIENSICARHFNNIMRENDTWYARLPNARGLNLDRSLKEFADFSWLLEQNNYCSRMLYFTLCFYYFPPCSPQSSPEVAAGLCQEVVREATEACLPIAQALHGDSVGIPHHLDYANFESKEPRVQDDIQPEVIGYAGDLLACPNATIHVDFSPPTGKLVYEVVEGAGSLEVCLVLANVGSFNKNSTLNTPVTVHLTTIQTAQTLYKPAAPGVDYSPLSTTLVFPVGSHKRHRLCANLPIAGNTEVNSDKSLSLKAVIVSPNSASFGGSVENSAGTMEVIIVDDDDIRVGFKLPAGKAMYESDEDRGGVEICLTLVSDYQETLDTAVTVSLSPVRTDSTIFVRAEAGLDYPVRAVSVEFPAGSAVSHTECANLSVTADGLVEADESFSVHASISSLDSTRFVSELQPSAKVEVIIRDDDECVLPVDQCRRNCDTRDNASRGIFKHNCYTFAAHVEVIGHRNLQDCLALDVTVLACWELQSGVCVSNGTRLSVPVCPNCENDVIVGREYLIAGLHDSNVGMFLPNYKKGGLIGEWVDRKYSSLSEWVQAGIDYKRDNDVDASCDE